MDNKNFGDSGKYMKVIVLIAFTIAFTIMNNLHGTNSMRKILNFQFIGTKIIANIDE